jgi:TonB-linked SusC/RagA family outer membrane protein
MNKYSIERENPVNNFKLALKTVKITNLFLFFCILFLEATTSYSQVELTHNLKSASIKEICEEIENKSNYRFIFAGNVKKVINKKVNLATNSQDINEILDIILSNTYLAYKILDNQVVIYRDETKNIPEEIKEIIPELLIQQQKKQITGRVTDAQGEPIIGANIIEAGTTNGTVTDIDGNYSLSVEDNATLQVSYIGYLSQNINTGGRTNFNITLLEDTQALDEIVVVGYGIQKKVNVVGSIATVDGQEFEGRAQPSVISALTGKMAGVTITQAGGRPGINTGTIRIRGVGSFGATPNALILIDGIPGNLTDVNPIDIESISVLKDASSAAIYGARAANGVVLVTTKMGRTEKITFSYNGYLGRNKPTFLPDMVNTWEYAEALNIAEGITRFSNEEIQAMKDGSMPDLFANDNYLNDTFSGNGFHTGHDLSVTGGSDRSNYFASFGYLNQNGLIPKNNYVRYTGRVNLTSKFSDKFDMAIRLRSDNTKIEEPLTNNGSIIENVRMMGLTQASLRFPGYRPSILSDGAWGPGFKNLGAPKSWLSTKSLFENPTFRLNSSIQFNLKPFKGMVISAIGAYNFTNSREKMFRATLPIKIDGNVILLGPSMLDENSYNTTYKSFQSTADYTRSLFNTHNIGLLVGYSWEDETQRGIGASRDNFPSNNLPYLTAGSPDNQQNSGGGYDWVIQSLFSRMQYNYMERYLFEGTFRIDGSSRFPVNERYGLFPSAAIGWRISEEDFIKNNDKLNFINNLKLKASIGVLGNNNIGNYAFQSVYNLGPAFNYPIGQIMAQGARLTTYTDPNLKWETTRTSDIGIETVLYDGLLSAEISYFYRYTYDILYRPNTSTSSIFGLNMSEVNTGELSNRGWEIIVGHQNKISNFKYSFNANFTTIKNKIETLGLGDVVQANGMVGNGTDLFINYPMELYYGYKTDGVFLDQTDINSWFEHTNQTPMGSDIKTTKPGDIRYLDISGPDGVPDGRVDPTYDRVYLGSRIPKYTFGLTLNAEYKGFDINIFFQGIAGVNGLLDENAGWAFWSEGNIQRWQYEQSFDPSNPTRYPKYPRLSNLENAIGVNTQSSDFWVRDASYLRLKSTQIGYSIPYRFLTNTFISNIRIYTTAENPHTWHKYPPGWDPEMNASTAFYPFIKTFTFGLNIKF